MPAHLDGEKMKIFASGCNSVFRSIVGQIPILSQDSPNGHKTWKSWPNRCRSSQRRHAISDVYEFLQGNGCTFPVSFGSKWSFLGAPTQWSSIEAGQGAARWWKWCGKPPGGVWWSKFTTSLLLKAAFLCISHDYIPIQSIYSDITLVAIYPIKYRYHILWYLPFLLLKFSSAIIYYIHPKARAPVSFIVISPYFPDWMFKTAKKINFGWLNHLKPPFFIFQPHLHPFSPEKPPVFTCFPRVFQGTSHVFPWNIRRLPGRQRRVAEDEATLQGALRVRGALCGGAVLGEEDLAAHLADAVFLLGVCVCICVYIHIYIYIYVN